MKYYLPHIIFEVTTDCNLNCRYCYNIWKAKRQYQQQYSYEQAKQTLAKFSELIDYKNIVFTGGEPLLAAGIEKLIENSLNQNKNVTIITNGTNSSLISDLIEKGVSLFEVPLLSAKPETHDYLTQSKGSWTKSVSAIKQIIIKRGNVIPVIVATKQNSKDIENTLHYINNLGLKQVMINRFNIGGEGINQYAHLQMTKLELNNMFRIVNYTAAKLDIYVSSNVCTPICVVNPKDYPLIQFGHCLANIMNRPITLDIKGNIRVCNNSYLIPTSNR